MSKPAIVARNAATPQGVSPSQALVSAALAGLLCAATPACNSASVDDGAEPMTGATGGAQGASGGASSAGGGAPSAGGRATTGGTSNGGAGGDAIPSTGGSGSGGTAESEAGTAPDASTSTGGADAGSVFPQPGDAGVDCRTDGGTPVVTSSRIVRDLTLERFTAECDAWHGVVQIPPHCGGFNTCRGMSYDSATDVLTEHTCRGLSTCSGFSCVLCPP